MEGTKKFHVFRYNGNLELSITFPCFYFVIKNMLYQHPTNLFAEIFALMQDIDLFSNQNNSI